ncbi:elongation factor P maturation arginine rhamnosyltransferase EarP [Marinobacterium sedimentorum]|uniref:elongation factor P maturation arginine rhamnosyltransferase EarP n=1 Tax=Marinobacterium sedimentorum TaxID=2927804 RepID=UPI0020C66BFB|nr:elongation factor P maturation arginine rhamnosyltransferase EarP [Marinobacterium sedimentorum]
MRASWDIFCSVIDNFGDIGVTWRLARQLVAEHDQEVRLWVDDLECFARLCPAANAKDAQQLHQGVRVQHWLHDPLQQDPSPQDQPPSASAPDYSSVKAADVVIEAFACQLPDAYIAAMAQRARPSLWLNLEYLSAEDWVAGCHGLPSLQPRGLQKYFFFPGFTPDTGGLLREAGLIEQRRRFQQDPAARQQFLNSLGVIAQKNSRLVSLFSYENKSLFSWLDTLAAATRPTQLLVPQGRIIAELQEWLGVKQLSLNDQHQRGALKVQLLPFLSQPDYDRLLWSCDLNVVRGEDSFVRAQWAAKPLLWHIYPQQENAHMDKLDAFLKLYCHGLSPAAGTALQAQWHAWNSGLNMAKSEQALRQVWPELEAHSDAWCTQLSAQINISTALVQFFRKWL